MNALERVKEELDAYRAKHGEPTSLTRMAAYHVDIAKLLAVVEAATHHLDNDNVTSGIALAKALAALTEDTP